MCIRDRATTIPPPTARPPEITGGIAASAFWIASGEITKRSPAGIAIRLSLIHISLNAYIQGNDKRAHEIAEQQYVIKSMSHEIQEKILDGMKENSETVTTGKEYLLTLVYLERITGYAVNLCEWIVYLNSGNIIEL